MTSKSSQQIYPVECPDDIEDGVFEFKQYGKAVYRQSEPWIDSNREDRIVYNEEEDKIKMDANIKIGATVASANRSHIQGIVK